MLSKGCVLQKRRSLFVIRVRFILKFSCGKKLSFEFKDNFDFKVVSVFKVVFGILNALVGIKKPIVGKKQCPKWVLTYYLVYQKG